MKQIINRKKWGQAVVVLLLLISFGCGGTKSPGPSRIGVFVDAGSLIEITSYAEQSVMDAYNVPEKAGILQVDRINAFYINMPDVKITGSRVLWIPVLEKRINVEKSELIQSQIDKNPDGVYKITSASLTYKNSGIVGLKVSMPLGTPDRIYLVTMGEKKNR